ncbi:conserved hypothetical protein [Leishmania major strain Friedlin]|uniref:Uncharacterized protein n=1 Tax=Leishmania major TaxID=5664 RepID=Q4QFI6_LEIMA|nr:conserved hypothetical protein [Leishmania major strain Friedlin]CAG9571343.1 hypothetical_protein_-_conserved [Leishmania major strain Friedlin]CAJ03222.1 conserved hypothetical protein [Leishmania major strain Friedlin]|eukprot:XP_001687748.1 conserved hypothetical protein [Leishmania major strain Friedlin]
MFSKGYCVLLRPYQHVAFAKRSSAGGVNLNKGALTKRERGDSFTEPEVYRSKTNLTAMLKTRRKERGLLKEEKQRTMMDHLNLDTRTAEALHAGRRLPQTPAEIQAVRSSDDALVEDSHGSQDYSTTMRNLMRREVDRRDHMADKFGQPPTSREFYQLFRKLRSADSEEEAVEQHQRRLVEEHGVYPSSRIDSFMMDDDSYFPDWVHALPYSIRDRVKYGSLGLTEDDEALRVRLARLPRDARLREWKRLKAAKEYSAATEETLTLAELRDARQGKRRFHWLQRKRQKRAAALRRMAMRKPDGYELWPSSVKDFSQRIAFIAQHVENGLQTGGEWPLNEDALTKAKIKRRQSEAERTFLMSPDEKKMATSAGGSSMHGGMKELLDSLDEPEKRYTKLSRKTYANRVNAIVHGDQDEHGRQYRRLHNLATRRQRRYDSLAEMALEKELRKEPLVNVSGLNHTDDEHWSRHEKSWVEGMPSTRYGS